MNKKKDIATKNFYSLKQMSIMQHTSSTESKNKLLIPDDHSIYSCKSNLNSMNALPWTFTEFVEFISNMDASGTSESFFCFTRLIIDQNGHLTP